MGYLMIKKIVLWNFLIIFLVRAGLAQKVTPYGKSDPEAKTILDKASKKFAALNSAKATFTLKTTTVDQKSAGSQEGTLWLEKGRFKFRLGEQTVYCDGKTLWTYNKENNEVQITDYRPQKGDVTPSALFSDFYDKNFLYRLSGSSTVKGKSADVIEMTPLDKSKPYFKILMLIDKKEYRLLSMEIFAKGGYRYTYVIDNFTPNAAVSDTDFVFNKADHPGVEVVDLRM